MMQKGLHIVVQIGLLLGYIALYILLQWNQAAGYTQLIALSIGLSIGSILAFLDDMFLVQIYTEPDRPRRPITRSMIVLLALIPLGVFVLTSTASVLAVGFYFGFASTMMTELLLLRNQPEIITQKFLWQLARPVDAVEVRKIILFAVVLQVVFSIFFLW